MKHDVPAPPARQFAEDPTALLGNPWADLELPPDRRRRSLATVWPFHHRETGQTMALLRGENRLGGTGPRA